VVPQSLQPRTYLQPAPLAFLSAGGDRRHDAAASDGAGVRARLAARLARGHGGRPQLDCRRCCSARDWRGRDGLRAPRLSARRQVSKRVVLITGASGFIGKHVTRTLAAAGWAVRAAARDPATIPQAPGVQRAVLPDLAMLADWTRVGSG